jgi:hypothetical protein
MGRLAMLVYSPPSGLTLLPLGEVSSPPSSIHAFADPPTLDFPRIDLHLSYLPSGLRRVLPGGLAVDHAAPYSVEEF